MTDHPKKPQKPMTHTAWTPRFDEEGNFEHYVEIGYGSVETDANGTVTSQIFREMQVVGYDSCYICLAPLGQEPPAPPPEVIEEARFEAAQRKKNLDFGTAA